MIQESELDCEHVCFRHAKQSELDCEREKLEELQRVLERKMLDVEGQTQIQQDQLMADFEQVIATLRPPVKWPLTKDKLQDCIWN